MTLKSFLAGCWFDHANKIRERRGRHYLLVCERCGSEVKVLPGQRLKVRTVPVKRPSKSLQFPRRSA